MHSLLVYATLRNLLVSVRLAACSGIGLAARYVGDKNVATAQVANTGLVSFSYIQKISDKVGREDRVNSRQPARADRHL